MMLALKPVKILDGDKMNITIPKKEIDEDSIFISRINFAFLVMVKNDHPKIWEQFKRLISLIEHEELFKNTDEIAPVNMKKDEKVEEICGNCASCEPFDETEGRCGLLMCGVFLKDVCPQNQFVKR